MNKKDNKNVIGLITIFGNKPGDIFLFNLIEILSSFSNTLHIIGSFNSNKYLNNNIVFHQIKIINIKKSISKILNPIIFQIKFTLNIIKYHQQVNYWIFFGGEWLSIPILMIKIFKGHSTIILAGSLENESKFGNKLLFTLLIFSKKISCHLTDQIIIYSPRLIDIWGIKEYENKIKIAHEHFINFNLFNVKQRFDLRKNKIGFIGRISSEKGILNFIEAISIISKNKNNYEFIIIGDGPLLLQMRKLIDNNNLNSKIKLYGWIPHEKLPIYLNDLKLVVIPSYTEGLPNVMLEAMACSTPVLATPVGAIPDIIKDNETGFIMENNSPEYIAKNIVRALNHSNLEQIANKSKSLIEKKFTIERAIEKYKEILE